MKGLRWKKWLCWKLIWVICTKTQTHFPHPRKLWCILEDEWKIWNLTQTRRRSNEVKECKKKLNCTEEKESQKDSLKLNKRQKKETNDWMDDENKVSQVSQRTGMQERQKWEQKKSQKRKKNDRYGPVSRLL